MHESVVNRLRKEQLAFVLAASDMEQAAAAARALADEESEHLSRALETAMVVCYMRPFTQSTLLNLDAYAPHEGDEALAHNELKDMRDQVYAHTDKEGGRKAELEVDLEGEFVSVVYLEQWIPFPRSSLPFVIELCERMRDHFRAHAARTQLVLDGRMKS